MGSLQLMLRRGKLTRSWGKLVRNSRTEQLCCTIPHFYRTMNVAIAVGLPAPTLDIGPRCMHAAFEEIKYNFLGTKRDIVLCKLKDVNDLAAHVGMEGRNFMKDDFDAASALLKDIASEPLPYGWFIQDILFVTLCTLAAIAAFFGSYFDMLAAFIISCFILMIKKLCAKFPVVLGPLETLLVCAASGLLTGVAARLPSFENSGDTICNIPIIFLSPLLVYLPGKFSL